MQRNILGIVVAAGILLCSSISFGVVVTGSSTAPTQDALYSSGMTYAYSVGRAMNTGTNQLRGGAVYIGQAGGYSWCLSAYHLTAGDGIQQVIFDESGTPTTYNITQVIRIASDASSTNADLCLLRLNGAPEVEYFDWRNLTSQDISVGSSITTVGCGRTRTDISLSGSTGYTVNAASNSQPTTYGTNTVDAIQNATTLGTSVCYYFDWDRNGGGSYQGAYTNGDSGGGTFYYNSSTSSWSLIGINVGTNAASNSEILFGQLNVAVDLSYYVNNIGTQIPEPATIALLTVGGAVALLRRRRK